MWSQDFDWPVNQKRLVRPQIATLLFSAALFGVGCPRTGGVMTQAQPDQAPRKMSRDTRRAQLIEATIDTLSR
jgi:hypothetical protein